MPNTKPTIIFVPGAWHIPAHYEPIVSRLRNSGYEVEALRHPSCTSKSDRGNMLYEDAGEVARVLRKVLSSGKDAVMIMHSYGGISGPEGVGVVFNEERSQLGAGSGQLRRLIFLAAHVLDQGVSFEGLRGRMANMDVDENGMMRHRYPKERYYNDVSDEDAKSALDMLQPMTYSAFTTPTRYVAWRDFPCSYIKCLKDNAVTSAMWDPYIARWKDEGIEYSAEELDTSHSPFWSDPDGLLEVLKRVIG